MARKIFVHLRSVCVCIIANWPSILSRGCKYKNIVIRAGEKKGKGTAVT